MNKTVKVELKNFDEGVERLRLVTLPPEQRKRYLRRMLGQARKLARKNVKAQREVDGGSFVPRKERTKAKWGAAAGDKLKKGKLLWNLAKAKLFNIWVDDYEATIRYQNPVTGAIAMRHQKGLSERFQVKKIIYPFYVNPKKRRRPAFPGGCTIHQACMMFRMGFVYRGRRPDWRWIMKNIPKVKAGYILDALMKKAKYGTAPEIMKVPARPFLGMTSEQFWAAHDEVWPTINKHWGRGRRRS